MRLNRMVWLLLSLLLLPCVAVQAGDGFILRAGTLHTGLRAIDDGVIVVVDDKVVQTGPWGDLHDQIPDHLPLIHWPDAYVTPGFVAASSRIVAPHRGPESISAAYRAADGFNRYGDHRPLLKTGITTAHVSPGEHRLLSGLGAVVKLVGTPSERVLKASADLSLSLTDDVDGPAALLNIPFPASSDVEIQAGTPQRPQSRIGRLLALSEAIALSQQDETAHGELRQAWATDLPLRIAARRAPEILAAVSFIEGKGRSGYIVGGDEIAEVVASLVAADLSLVLRIRPPGTDLGVGADTPSEGLSELPLLGEGAVLALAPPMDDFSMLQWAMAQAAARLEDPADSVSMVTHHPARILGVGDRVGNLEPGADADIVVWSMSPWQVASHPLEVFVGGERAWQSADNSSTVIKAGTIWISPEERIFDGEILVENGTITAVGRTVPHPPAARVIDAGPESFVVPGFIDCYGHLGLRGDVGASGTSDRLFRLIGVPDEPEHRVARAGVTSQLMTPRRLKSSAGAAVLVKTMGHGRSDRVSDQVSALLLEVRGHPTEALGGIQRLFGQGKKYLDSWVKYEKDLAEWQKKKAAGEKIEIKDDETEEEVVESEGPDPLTGIWQVSASGGPLPEPETAKLSIQLNGSKFEGRVIEPTPPIPVRIVGTLEGTTIEGTVEVDADVLPAPPKIAAELTGEDELKGTISVLQFSVDLTGTRTSKEAKTFKVERRKRRGDDGRPNPPRVSLALEPIRQVLEKKIPVVVTPVGFGLVPKVVEFFSKQEIPLTLRLDQQMRHYDDLLAEKSISVILPAQTTFKVDLEEIAPASFLTRAGINVAFQSMAADGARSLPLQAMRAVRSGLSADDAIEALTRGAAQALGVAEKIGSIEPGLDADLLIWDGHPFEAGSDLQRVFIHGEEVPR
ncbi:MAG: amidohydrolase family protein [Planctomycetota bacterium]|nr:amidohydrolase family protein [Planctomycetota bacterium]